MQDKVFTILSEVLVLSKDKINESTEMKSVESWDSLRHMELIALIEETFGIELEVDEIVKMNSVSGILTVLEKRNIS